MKIKFSFKPFLKICLKITNYKRDANDTFLVSLL